MEKKYKYICMCIFSGKFYETSSNKFYKKGTLLNGYEYKECYVEINGSKWWIY